MRAGIGVTVGLVLLAGCGPSTDVVVAGDPVDDPYAGPMDLPIDHSDDATVLERSGAAGRALECEGRPYDGGGADYDSGLATVQDDAESALANLFEEDPLFDVPRDGYRVEREDGGRVLLSYDVDGRTKVAFIAAEGIRDWDGDQGWGIEAWAQCDPSELPAPVTEDLGIQVWEDTAGNRVPVATIRSFQGPEHCDWQDVTFLVLEDNPDRQYVRDPSGALAGVLRPGFEANSTLPENATDTGYERDGRHLWLGADAAYLVDTADPSDVERWPLAKGIACA